MLPRASHRRWITWLAFAALCLNLVAPSVSRTLMADASSLDLGAWCTSEGLSDHHAGTPDTLHHGDACGYCALVSHGPLLASGTDWKLPPSPTDLPPGHAAVERFIVVASLAAQPRGPPIAG